MRPDSNKWGFLLIVSLSQANYKISVIRLRHEIEDLKRRVEAMEIKVEAETRVGVQD